MMILQERILKQCREEADVWIAAQEKHGHDPFGEVVKNQRVMRGLCQVMGNNQNETMITLPFSLVVTLAALGMAGAHVVVTRLLATGKISEEHVGLHGNEEEEQDGD